MINFDSELVTILVLSSIMLGLIAPYIAKGFQHLGLMEIEGDSIEE